MASGAKFCGKCGAQLTAGARFCGQCGWQVPNPVSEGAGIDKSAAAKTEAVSPQDHANSGLRADNSARKQEPGARPQVSTPPDSAQTDSAPPQRETQRAGGADGAAPLAAAKSANQPQRLLEMIGHGLQWAPVWLLGWVPFGAIMAVIWAEHRVQFREFYDMYSPSVPWGQTLPGAITGFAAGGFIAGLLAGAFLKWLRPASPAINAARATAVLAVWLAGGALAISYPASLHYSGSLQDVDLFIIFILAATPLAAIVAAWVDLRLSPANSADGETAVKPVWFALSWAGAALVGLLILAVIVDV